MSKEVAGSINSCLPEAAEVVVLPAKEYVSLLSCIQQMQRIIDVYIAPDVDMLNSPDNNEWIAALERRRKAQQEYGARLADVEERLEQLEVVTRGQKRAPGKVTEGRMLKLAVTLVNRRNAPISFSEISKLLELGSRSSDGKKNTRKQNMTHFGRILEDAHDKFVIRKDSHGHKCAQLTKSYYNHLVEEYLG